MGGTRKMGTREGFPSMMVDVKQKGDKEKGDVVKVSPTR